MNRAYELARAEIGTFEWAEGSNPRVVAYYADAGHPGVKQDSVAWCSAFCGAMLARAGLKPSGSLAARSYLEWGEPVDLADAREGDLVILWRGSPDGWQGHVAFLVEDMGDKIAVLGGNQSDRVSVSRYSKNRLLGIRRAPEWAASPPDRALDGDTAAPAPEGPPVPLPAPRGFLRRLWRLLKGLFA